MRHTLAEAVAAALPDTVGGWVALAGTSLLEGLLSPYTWVAIVGGALLAPACGFMEGKPLPRLLTRTRQ